MSQLFKAITTKLVNVRSYSNRINKIDGFEKSINSVQLLGRVGVDPETRGNKDHPVVIFTLATHSNYRYESGDFQQKTDWHRICAFKPTLREMIVNYLRKGQRVFVTGRLMYGSITTESGTVKQTTSIVADDVIFLTNSVAEKTSELDEMTS